MSIVQYIFNYNQRLRFIGIIFIILMLGVLYIHMNNFSERENLIHKYKVKEDTRQFSTIFTSWSTTKEKSVVHNNTLHLWAQLLPDIQPVLFTNESVLAQKALALGWKVLPILHVFCGNMPVLKSMFLDVQRYFPSQIYGYANSDILFDHTLNTTLKAIILYKQFFKANGFLVTGRRMNVNFHNNLTVNSIRNLSTISSKGSLARIWGEDYFFTGDSFPWKIFPNMVIGRVAFDNYIVIFSKKNKADVIDTTSSILAVHQTTSDGNLASAKRPNAKCNVNLIGQQPFRRGYVDCISLETKYDFYNIIHIMKRNMPRLCF